MPIVNVKPLASLNCLLTFAEKQKQNCKKITFLKLIKYFGLFGSTSVSEKIETDTRCGILVSL